MVIALCIVAHIAADFAAVPVSIRFLRSTGGLRGPRPPLSALLDKRGRKSFGWRKRWHLKVLLLTYDSSRVTPFWRCPLFSQKSVLQSVKSPRKVSVCTKLSGGSNNYFGTLCYPASNGSYARPYVDLNELQFLTNSSTKKTRRTNATEHHHHQEKCSILKNTGASAF